MRADEDRRDAVTVLAQMCDRLVRLVEDEKRRVDWSDTVRHDLFKRLDEIGERLDALEATNDPID